MRNQRRTSSWWVWVLVVVASWMVTEIDDAATADDAIGRWTVAVDPLGEPQIAQLEVRQAFGKLTATLGNECSAIEIDEIVIAEDTLRFHYQVNIGQTEQPVQFQLTASETGFDGTLTTGTEPLSMAWPIQIFRAKEEANELPPSIRVNKKEDELAALASPTVAKARDYVGAWEVTLRKEDNEKFAVKLGILVMEVEGRVVVGHSQLGMKGPQKTVSDVSGTPNSLMWKYDGTIFGPLNVTMSKNDDQLKVRFASKGQELVIRGIGVRRQSGSEIGVDPELLAQRPGIKRIGKIDNARVVQVQGQRIYIQQGRNVSVLLANQPLLTRFKLFDLPEGSRCVFISDSRRCVVSAHTAIQIWDMSQPTTPRELGSCSFPGNSPDALKSDGSLVLVANWNGRADSQQIHLIDVSDAKHPTLRRSISTPRGSSNKQIDMLSSKVFLATDLGLRIIDVSNPDAPVEVSLTAGRGRWVRGVDLSGSKAYLATSMNGGASWLQIINVSNPLQPVSVGLFQTTGGAQDVAVSRSRAYVADRSEGLVAIDVSDPGNPRQVGFYRVSGITNKVSIAGDLVFLNVSDGQTSDLVVLKSEL